MLGGFNTDVKHGGKLYHVQTEDKGKNNPIIETLIYTGGEIIDVRRISYEAILKHRGFQPQLILKLMERQHQLAISDIRAGKYDEEKEVPPSPIESMYDASKTLDEVILDYLATQTEQDTITLDFDRDRFLYEGERVDLLLRARFEVRDQPVEGADVIIKILSTTQPPLIAWMGTTDETGTAHARFQIPEFEEGSAALLIQVFWGTLTAEEKMAILKPLRKKRPTQSLEAS